jgi:hypothetical protein
MRVPKLLAAAAAAMAPLVLGPAAAQLPLYTLPKDDFRWNWGTANLDRQRGMADIEISGSESFFRCDFTARMKPSSTMTQSDIRALENDLRSRLDFIYAVSETMYYLDQSRQIDWATLDCKRYEPEPKSAEERAERENEAREKMLRELEKRRSRQQRD